MNNSDFIALLVGSLGVMTALLLSWQLYTAFNLKRIERSMLTLRNQTISDVNKQMKILHDSQSVLFLILSSESKNYDLLNNYLMFSLYSIYYSHISGDKETCNKRSMGLLDVLSTKKLEITRKTANQAIDFLLSIEGGLKISGYKDLLHNLYDFRDSSRC